MNLTSINRVHVAKRVPVLEFSDAYWGCCRHRLAVAGHDVAMFFSRVRAGALPAVLAMSMALAAVPCCARAAEAGDPMNSPVWGDLAKKVFAGAPYVYDERVKVIVPSVVEDQAAVPITADARGIGTVTKLAVIADLNPIQHVLTLSPDKAEPYVSVRLKVEQGTPVRAAALTSDGVWHVGSTYLDAMGGGCTAPAMARKDADWTTTVGQTQGRIWRESEGTARLRLRMRHPMDTGLAKDGTPAFFIERVDVKDPDGGKLATVEMYEPVSEDPTMTLLITLAPSATAVTVDGRDTAGEIFRANIPAGPLVR